MPKNVERRCFIAAVVVVVAECWCCVCVFFFRNFNSSFSHFPFADGWAFCRRQLCTCPTPFRDNRNLLAYHLCVRPFRSPSPPLHPRSTRPLALCGDSYAFNVLRQHEPSVSCAVSVTNTMPWPSLPCHCVVDAIAGRRCALSVASTPQPAHAGCSVPVVMIRMNFSFVKIITQFCGLNRSFILFSSVSPCHFFFAGRTRLCVPAMVLVGLRRFLSTNLSAQCARTFCCGRYGHETHAHVHN